MKRLLPALLLIIFARDVDAQAIIYDLHARCLVGPSPDATTKLEIGKPWSDPLGRPKLVGGGVYFQHGGNQICADTLLADPEARTVGFSGNARLVDQKRNITRAERIDLNDAADIAAFFKALEAIQRR